MKWKNKDNINTEENKVSEQDGENLDNEGNNMSESEGNNEQGQQCTSLIKNCLIKFFEFLFFLFQIEK